jgi:predicted phosphoribosyltransferase
MSPLFADRRDAGRALASHLAHLSRLSRLSSHDGIVLALPRGGVPVGVEVAGALGLPLDVFVVRKLGVPGREELAMGAVASGGVLVENEHVMQLLGLSRAVLDRVMRSELRELARREALYRAGRPPLDVRGRPVVIVDDGLATGSTMRAAIAALRKLGAASILVAVPVGAAETCDELRREVDGLVCVATPEPFVAVGLAYADFAQVTDDEVCALLDAEWRARERGVLPEAVDVRR